MSECEVSSNGELRLRYDHAASSDATFVPGAGGSSLECEMDVMQAIRAVDALEIECLMAVFELDVAAATKYHEEAVPPRNGTSFDAAVNTIITEYVAEILEYVDKKARKLHKMKQVVMRPATNWNNCRMHYFPFVPGRDPDPTGDAFASCFELVDNRALLPCDKKGCCVVKPPGLQPAGRAVVVCSERVSSVASSGKAKMVYNGKAKA